MCKYFTNANEVLKNTAHFKNVSTFSVDLLPEGNY